MKKLLCLTRLFVCLCAMLSSTSAFAGADWIGNSYIQVNGTWYNGSGYGWSLSDNYNDYNFGKVSALVIGASIEVHDSNSEDWQSGSLDLLFYRFDKTGDFHGINMSYKNKPDGSNNMVFETGGTSFSTTSLDISSLSVGEQHTLEIYFGPIDGRYDNRSGENYVATFTKVADISGATISGVDASYDWTGSVIHPNNLVVTLDNEELSSATDYNVSYSEGCTNVGDYTVTITGKGNYAGSIVKNFSILVPKGYYLVGDMNNWELKSTYQLTANTVTPGEYYINNVELSSGQGFKVVRTNDGKTKDVYYPDGTDNNYYPGTGKFFVYFCPEKKYNSGWHYDYIYATTTASADVNLAGTGYGTYYNSTCEVTLPSGVVAYIVTDATPTYEKIADGDGDGTDVKTTVPAGVAVLLYSASSSVALGLSTTITDSRTFNYNKLHGSDTETTTTGGVKYYKLTYGSIEGHESYFGWFYGADDGASFTSPAHKAWLALPNSASRGFLDLPDGDTTGIASIENKQQGTDNVWYDLNGRRIKAPTTKGIYVKDGRKLVIK